MTAYAPPRRVTSTATTITVQAAATTALAQAAAAMTSNGPLYAFAGNGLSTQIAHPYTGALCDPTQDGGNGAPLNLAGNRTILEWCGKGCYDPTRRTVRWMGAGTGNDVKLWHTNTMPVYDEATNQWSAVREWRMDVDAANADATGLGHTYDNNCISVAAGKVFKRQYKVATDGNIRWHVYNLATGTWEASIAGPTGAHVNQTAPGEVIANRGALGRLWHAHDLSSSGVVRIQEYDIANGGSWSTVIAAGAFPALVTTWGQGNLSYNPRAFGGLGGAMLAWGSTTSYVIRTDTLAVTAKNPISNGLAIDGPNNGHLCRDPVGTGWLLFCSDGYVWKCTDTGDWTNTGRTHGLTNISFITVPIDQEGGNYGVVWLIVERDFTISHAWLYKP